METSERFFRAVRAGDQAAVDGLLDEDPDLISRHAPTGTSAIRFARDCGHPALARRLAELAGPLDAFDALAAGNIEQLSDQLSPQTVATFSDDGWTLLHLAAFYGEPAVSRVLIERGASVSAVSRNATANQPLHAGLAGAGSPEVLTVLLEAGADVNYAGGGGVTPLHLAAARGDDRGIDRLLAAGARPGATTDHGKTPAAFARERGHPDVAARLDGLS